MRNPYIVGQVVYRPHFYGRQSLVDDILDERKQCIYLIGNRRIGKTSLLRYLEDTVGFPTIYLNLQSTMGDPARMKRELIRRVNEKTRQIPLFEKIDLSTAGDICDVVNILATAAELNGTMIFQLWDEAEILLGLDTNFLGRLRSAIHEKRHLRTSSMVPGKPRPFYLDLSLFMYRF
jgi:hypothetical protein